MHILKLTGAAENSDGHPLYIPAHEIKCLAVIEQIRRVKNGNAVHEVRRLVTEVWYGQNGCKHVREHIEYVRHLWFHARNLPDTTHDSVAALPATADNAKLAALTYAPATEAQPATVKRERAWRWR